MQSNNPQPLALQATALKSQLILCYHNAASADAGMDRLMRSVGTVSITFAGPGGPDVVVGPIDLGSPSAVYLPSHLIKFLAVYGSAFLGCSELEQQLRAVELQLKALGEGDHSGG